MNIKLAKISIISCCAIAIIFGVSCSNEVTANPAPTILSPSHSSSNTSTPLAQVTSSPTLTKDIFPTENTFQYPDLKPGQYILYQTDKLPNANLSALSPYTGETYPLYDVYYPAQFEISPSLKRLAIVQDEQVKLIDLETGLTKTTQFDYVCSSAAWSPDESKLALTCGDVFIINFPDLNIFQLADLSSDFDEISWSPDGKWLAYDNVADPYGDDSYDGIYITDTTCLFSSDTCKEHTKFSHGLFYQFVDATWSLDSSELAFLALGNIYRLDIDDMNINLCIELPHENISDVTGFAWSVDGSQYAISNEITQRIVIISSKDGKEEASFSIAGTVLLWIKVP